MCRMPASSGRRGGPPASCCFALSMRGFVASVERFSSRESSENSFPGTDETQYHEKEKDSNNYFPVRTGEPPEGNPLRESGFGKTVGCRAGKNRGAAHKGGRASAAKARRDAARGAVPEGFGLHSRASLISRARKERDGSRAPMRSTASPGLARFFRAASSPGRS